MAKKKKSYPAHCGLMYITSLTYSKRLLLMVCSFVFMMAMASFASQLASLVSASGTRTHFLCTSALQNIIGFAGTAAVCAFFLYNRPLEMLGLSRIGSWACVGGILFVFAVGLPFLNQVVWWNSQMHFPAEYAAIEQTLRSWEDAALYQTTIMLSGTSVSTLLLNILLVGIITGLCEELVFRGAIQRIISSGPIGPHLSIWITAIIFSLLHFQFFGFLPRVLLGAFFGYVFYWTGSIWMSATAHAINNSLVVIFTWLQNNGMQVGDIDSFGVASQGFPVMACISFSLTLFVLVGLRKYLFTDG